MKRGTPVPVSVIGHKAFFEVSMHHLQSPHLSLAGRHLRVTVTVPDLTADVVAGDFAVPEDVSAALAPVCPCVPSADKGLVLSNVRGSLAVDMRPPESVLHQVMSFSPNALARALANGGCVELVRIKVSIVHIGEGGLTELVASGGATVDLRRVLLEDKVSGVRVATAVGQVGVMFAVSQSDREGFRKRLAYFLSSVASPPGSAPPEERARLMLEHGNISEAFVFLQLRQRVEGTSVKERFNAFAALYRLPSAQLMEMLEKWSRHELRALAMLCMAIGPEGGDVDMLTRVTQYALSHDLDLHETLRWLASATYPAAKELADDRIEEKCDTFFPDAAARNAAMARLVEKHGPEAPPATYLYRQGLAAAPKLELSKATSPLRSFVQSSGGGQHSPSAMTPASVSFRSNVPTHGPAERSSPRGFGDSINEPVGRAMPPRAPPASQPQQQENSTGPSHVSLATSSPPQPPLRRAGTLEPEQAESDGSTSRSSSPERGMGAQARQKSFGAQRSATFRGGLKTGKSFSNAAPSARSEEEKAREAAAARRKASIARKTGVWNPNAFLEGGGSGSSCYSSDEEVQPMTATAPTLGATANATSAGGRQPEQKAPHNNDARQVREPPPPRDVAQRETRAAANDAAVHSVKPAAGDASRPDTNAVAAAPSRQAPDEPATSPSARRDPAAVAERRRAAAAARSPVAPPRHAAAAATTVVRTADEAVQVDSGKAPPVIVAVPTSATGGNGVSAVSSAVTQSERVWATVLAAASELHFSDAFVLTGDERDLHRLLSHASMAKRLPVSMKVDDAVAAIVDRRRALLQHVAQLRPATCADPSVAQIVAAFARSADDPRGEQPNFTTHLAFVVQNTLLDDAFDRHVSLQRAHRRTKAGGGPSAARGNGGVAPSDDNDDVVRCFAWCADVTAATDAATYGVPATAAAPFVWRRPHELRRSALNGGGSNVPSCDRSAAVSTLGEASPRVWGGAAAASTRAAGTTPTAADATGAILVCDVYVGAMYRTVMSAVPSGVPLRADVDTPLATNAAVAMDADGTGRWEGATGAVYDSALLRHGTAGEALAVFSPQQVRVRCILVGAWQHQPSGETTSHADRLRTGLSPPRTAVVTKPSPPRSRQPSEAGIRLPEASFALEAERRLTADNSATSAATSATPQRPGTWSHCDAPNTTATPSLGGLVAAASPPPTKPADAGAEAVRLEIARGFRLFRAGQREQAASVWTQAATSGAEASPTFEVPDDELSAEERAVRLEALGILYETIERDARAAETAYRGALDRAPESTSLLFRLGSLLETALHEHGAALALFDRAANLGDPAAMRRGQLLRRRMSLNS